jgi:hypothetical protein
MYTNSVTSDIIPKNSIVSKYLLFLSYKHCFCSMNSRINSTKSAASGASDVSKPSLMSEAGRMREAMRVYVSVFLYSE